MKRTSAAAAGAWAAGCATCTSWPEGAWTDLGVGRVACIGGASSIRKEGRRSAATPGQGQAARRGHLIPWHRALDLDLLIMQCLQRKHRGVSNIEWLIPSKNRAFTPACETWDASECSRAHLQRTCVEHIVNSVLVGECHKTEASRPAVFVVQHDHRIVNRAKLHCRPKTHEMFVSWRA